MSNIEQFIQIDFKQLFVWLALILLVAKALVDAFSGTIGKWLKSKGIETQSMREKREDHELIRANAQAIKDLAELHKKDNELSNEHDEMIREELHQFMDEVRYDIKTFTDNRVHDREQSLEIQEKWTDKIDCVFNRLDEMQKQTDERFAQSEAKTNKRVQSDIKERIAQSYRRYDKTKKISHMELEALGDLIDTYESFGGKNSFVHSVVQKEMYTWELTE